MSTNKKFDTALLVTAVTVLLYTWSTVLFNGFLGVMRLDADLMERNFHQVIYEGLLVSFAPIVTLGVLVWVVLFIWSHGILPIYVDWARSKIDRRRKVIRFRRFWYGKRNAAPAELRAKSLFTQASIGLIAVIAYIFSLAYFESIGTNKAKAILAEHISGNNKRSSMIQVDINGTMKTLRFLACGARTCSAIAEKTNIIFYFPTTKSYSFLHHEPNAEKRST